MALKPTFSMSNINELIERKKEAFHQAIVYRLNYLGLECYSIARERGSYIDQTGNLRSSTGYVISYNGVVVYERGFEKVAGLQSSTEDGTLKGKELAEKLVNEYNSGYSLIVVAGMEYALSVESKGYDVLTSAELYAKDEIKDVLKKVVNDVSKIK